MSAPVPTKKQGVPIKICLVGAGRLGRFRLDLMRESRRCTCVAIVEPDKTCAIWADAPQQQQQQQQPPQQQQQGAEAAPAGQSPSPPVGDARPRVYAALAEVDVRYDAIWVAAPVELRPAIIAKAVDLTRFVFCESPVATTEVAIKQCYDLCQSKEVELVCGWQRRYDDSFLELHDKITGMKIVSASFVSKGTSRPKKNTPGSVFYRVVAPMINLALMYMNEQMPVSVQATGRDAFGLGEWDSVFCSLEYAGGITLFIEASCYGSDTFENSVRVVADGHVYQAGSACPVATPRLAASEPGGVAVPVAAEERPPKDELERYAKALRTEVNKFARMCANEKIPRVCTRDHCVATAQLVAMAEQSARLGTKLPVEVGPSMRLLQIGLGTFGRHIQEKVLSQMPHCETVAIVTSRSKPDELQAHLESASIDSVYICLPYQLHAEYVDKCLEYSKKILCEKPVLDLPRLQRIAIERDRFLMVGLHRRFDRQFQRAKELTTQLVADGGLETLVVESRDTGPHMEDTIDTLWVCCIHDFDMISWLLEDVDCEITVKSIKVTGPASSFNVSLSIWLRKYDKTIDSEIKYSRAYPSYLNKVYVNGKAFGHDSRDPVFFNTYNDAYQRQFKFFASHPGNIPGQGKYCLTYTRGYLLTSHAVDLVTAEEDEEAGEEAKESLTALSTAVKRKSEATISPLPMEDMKEFRGVAGHGGILTQAGRLYKPLVHEENEWLVYDIIREQMPELVPWIPRIYERLIYNGVPYLVMEDLTTGYRKPTVLDLKVGEPSDFLRLQNQPYALKIAGYSGDTIVRRSQQSWTDLLAYFKDFIKDKETGNCRYEVLPDFIEQLKQLEVIFNKQTVFRMRAVSLLFIFDSTDSDPQQPAVRIVDMARAQHEGDEIDHFFCFGLENCIKLLQSVHEKFVNRHAVFLCRHGLDADRTPPPAPTSGTPSPVPNAPSPRAAMRDRDPPLSVEGMQQAYDMAHRLKYENISVIVSSPSYRALQTAKVIAQQLGVKYVIEPAMSSFQRDGNGVSVAPLSPLDALTSAQYASDPLLDRMYVPVVLTEPSTGLTWQTMQMRVHSALSSICSRYKRVAIVAHTSTFEALLSLVGGAPSGGWCAAAVAAAATVPAAPAPTAAKAAGAAAAGAAGANAGAGGLQFASITSMLPTHTPIGWTVERMNMSSHLTVFRGSQGLLRLPLLQPDVDAPMRDDMSGQNTHKIRVHSAAASAQVVLPTRVGSRSASASASASPSPPLSPHQPHPVRAVPSPGSISKSGSPAP
eukprot:m51a1_g936 putative phosphoglycerate mutase (1269) ;mRNA; f:243663-248281